MIIYTFSRIILGLFFFVLGINGFLHFLPTFNSSIQLSKFILALEQTNYFFYYFYILEIIIGVLLLINLLIPIVAVVSLIILAHFTLMYYYLVTLNWTQKMMIIFYISLSFNLIIIAFKAKKYSSLIK